MPCFHPQAVFQPEKNSKIKFLTKFEYETLNKVGFISKFGHLVNKSQTFKIKCGKCNGCRIDYSKMWSIRCMHELTSHQHSCFITLTYNDDNLPERNSLYYKHFQDFMKRLRIKYKDCKIRFYMCGEYGEKLKRPHYHAIIFGWTPPDKKFFKVTDSKSNVYTSAILDKLWGKGYTSVGTVTASSCAYVSRYIMKKQFGKDSEFKNQYIYSVDTSTGEILYKNKEFSKCSNRPGIAKDFYDKFKCDIKFLDGYIMLKDGFKTSIPRYYMNLLKKDLPDLYEKASLIRKQKAIELENMMTDIILNAKCEIHNSRISLLKRTL